MLPEVFDVEFELSIEVFDARFRGKVLAEVFNKDSVGFRLVDKIRVRL
jgi:deoxycytidine triphosphate deaminase